MPLVHSVTPRDANTESIQLGSSSTHRRALDSSFIPPTIGAFNHITPTIERVAEMLPHFLLHRVGDDLTIVKGSCVH